MKENKVIKKYGINFFAMPNFFEDGTEVQLLKVTSKKILSYLIRCTIGWHKEEFTQSTKDMSIILNLSTKTIFEAIKELKLKTMIIVCLKSRTAGNTYNITPFLKKCVEYQKQQKAIKNIKDDVIQVVKENTKVAVIAPVAVKKAKNTKINTQLELLLKNGIDQEIAEEYIDIRKQKRGLKITEKILERLAAVGARHNLLNLKECVEFCVEKSWAGLQDSYFTNIKLVPKSNNNNIVNNTIKINQYVELRSQALAESHIKKLKEQFENGEINEEFCKKELNKEINNYKHATNQLKIYREQNNTN